MATAKSSKKKGKPKEKAPETLPFEIDPQAIEASLAGLADKLSKWANKGRHTKVRFKFRGKQLLPDLPLAAVVAAQGLTFYWTGLLRALIVNVAGQTVLDVELVNESETEIARGKEQLLKGDVSGALKHFRRAEEMDHDNPRVHFNLGVALRLQGDVAKAREALNQAIELDPDDGPTAEEARALLAQLPT
jgi:tetratricopeptide (TPR) repeat protein